MVVYQSLVNTFVTPVIERHEARGRAEGKAQGIAQGKQEQNTLWLTWLQRKLEAEAQGLEFNELPPGTETPDHG